MAAENITRYTILSSEVMPAVECGYHVSRNREDTAIAGLSMGGAETVYTALNRMGVGHEAIAAHRRQAFRSVPKTPGSGCILKLSRSSSNRSSPRRASRARDWD
jgi:S-formylglutathione hydrolase FrmB